MGFASFVQTPVNWWNKIPFIRNISVTLFMIILPTPFVAIPGIISAIYVFLSVLLSVSYFISKTPLTRMFSFLMFPFTMAHLITVITCYYLNLNSHWALALCGLDFNKMGDLGYTRFVMSTCTISAVFIISIPVALSRYYPSNNKSKKAMKYLTSFLFFVLSFLLNASHTGAAPILFLLCSVAMFCIPQRYFTYFSIPIAFTTFLYIILWTFYSLYAWVAYKFDLFGVKDLSLVDEIMSTLGFTKTPLNSRVYTTMTYLSQLFFAFACWGISQVQVFNAQDDVPEGYQIVDDVLPSTQKESTFTSIYIVAICLKFLTKVLYWTKVTLKTLLEVVINCALYITLAIMFCVGLIDISVLGFSFMVLSVIYLFLPSRWVMKLWPVLIVFTLAEIVTLLIVQLDLIDISNVPDFIGLVKYNIETNSDVYKFEDTVIVGLFSRIFLLGVSVVQLLANGFESRIEHNETVVDIVKYCCAKIVDFWGIFFCCVFIAMAAFLENINIELLLYILALFILVVIQTHFKKYKKIIRFVLPVFAVIFFVVLVVRYLAQLADYEDTSSEDSQENTVNDFWDIFTKMNRSELGFIKYTTIGERILGFLPNIIVITICAIESQLLITVPQYLQEKRIERRRIRLDRSMAEGEQLDAKHEEKKVEINVQVVTPKADDVDYHIIEVKVPGKLRRLSNLFMRFLAIYLPHIAIICSIVIAAYPAVYSSETEQTWDILHLLLFITTLVSLLSKKGFNTATIPLIWVCIVALLFLVIPNFHTVNDFIDQSGIFSEGYKEWFYKMIGLKTCYITSTHVDIQCSMIDDNAYPNSWAITKDFVIILFLVILSSTSYFWGVHYEKTAPLVLFNYTEISKDTAQISLNKVKYYISNFFTVFGPLCTFIFICICCGYHGSDFLGLVYLTIALTGVVANQTVLATLIPISEIVLVSLLIFNSIWTIPLSGGPFEGITGWRNWDWDTDFTIRKYLLLTPSGYGEMLLVSRVLDSVCIFLIYRISYIYSDGHANDIYDFLCPYYFPERVQTFFDVIVKFVLKYIGLLCGIIVVFLSITRKDIFSYIYLGFTIYLIFKGGYTKQWRAWRILQGINILVLVLQNLVVTSALLQGVRDSSTNEHIKKLINFSLQVLRTFGLNLTTGKEFYINVTIYFILLARTCLIKHLSRALIKIDETEEIEKEKVFAKTKELIDLDRDKILLELDIEYNNKVMRMRRLEELRVLRKKDRLSDYNDAEIAEEAQSLPLKTDTRGFVEKAWSWMKKTWYTIIDSLIHFLHNRNIVVRLNLPKEATEEQIEKEMIDVMRPIIKEPMIQLSETEEYKIEKPNEQQSDELKVEKMEKHEKKEETTFNTEELLTQEDVAVTTAGEKQQYSLIDVYERKEEPYKHKSRLYMVLWGIIFYCCQQTEVFVQILFVINHMFNENILSMVYPLVGFGIIMLCKRPHPTKVFWNLVSLFCITLIFVRVFFSLPGFCIDTKTFASDSKDSSTFNVLRYQMNTTSVYCSAGAENSYNHMSPIYIIGVYPVSSYMASSFVWDIICLFAILLHVSMMRSNGYWTQQYLLRRQWSNLIIENYRRSLVNKLKPNSFGEILFVVETMTERNEQDLDYLPYKKHDLFIVENMQVDGSLYVKKGAKKGLIRCEDVQIYTPDKKKEEKIKTRNVKPQHKDTYDETYSVEEEITEKDEFDIMADANAMLFVEAELQINKKINMKQIDSYLMKQERFLREVDEIESHKSKTKKWLKNVGVVFKGFFDSVVNDKFKRGDDYYIPMLLSEVLCFLFLVIFQGTFTNIDGSFVEFFTGDYLPISYVLGLFLQFLMIITDRIIYLCKSITVKLVMQYFSLLLYHILIFIVYPSLVDKMTGIATVSLVIFYIFKVIYWVFSGLQIKSGYLVLSSKRILMKNYSYVSSLIFSTYYTLPFVYEIRTILDWTFAKTSMFYKMWLKVEDIHAELYMNQCDREIERGKNHVYGESRGVMEKLTGGCIMVVIIFAILWFPLLLMSSAAPNFIQPAPSNLDLSMSFIGSSKFFDQENTEFPELTGPEWKKIQENGAHVVKQDASQWIFKTVLSLESMSFWSLTPSKQEALNASFCDNKSVSIKTVLTMSRAESAALNTFSLIETYTLNDEEMKVMCDVSQYKEPPSTFYLEFFPQFVRMPTLSESTLLRYDQSNISLTPHLIKDKNTGLSYWKFVAPENSETAEMYIASPNVPNQGVISSLSSMGIIGLYTVVVLTLYNLIKSDYANQAHQIMFKNLPQCHGLLQLSDDIIIARQDGDLKLEEDLVNELIMIYRTPSLLIEKTKVE